MATTTNSDITGVGGGSVEGIGDVPGLQTALDGKISASTAITVLPKVTPMVASDILLGANSEAGDVPVTFTPDQLAIAVGATPARLAAIDAEIAEIALGSKLVHEKTTASHYVFGAYATILADMMRLCPGFGSSAKDSGVATGVTPTATIYIHPTLGLDANAGTSHTAPKQTLPASAVAATKYLVAAGTTVTAGIGVISLHTAANNSVLSVYDANASSPTYGQEITWQPDPFLRALFGGWHNAEERSTMYFTLQGTGDESASINARGVNFGSASAITCVRGAIIRGFRYAAVSASGGARVRVEDSIIEDILSAPSSANTYYGGAGIRCDAAASRVDIVRCFIERVGEDIFYNTGTAGFSFTDSAINHITQRQIYGVQHCDVTQLPAYPNQFVKRRLVIRHQVAGTVLLNSGNGETTAAGAVVMCTGTAGTDTPGGLIEDVVFVTNRQGTYFQRQTGVTLRRVVGLLVGDTSLSQAAAMLTWDRTGNTEDGCVFATYATATPIRNVTAATGAVNKATTIDLGRLDA